MTGTRAIEFAAVLTTALALVPAMAHALELPNKIRMEREDYLNAQRLYRGWQFVGIAVVAALISTGLLLRISGSLEFTWSLVAVLSVAATQIVFWVFTFPVNRRTRNWTEAPANWRALRARWEFSHAGSAALNLLALICVALVVVN
jgi:uncharacterized membrane protein